MLYEGCVSTPQTCNTTVDATTLQRTIRLLGRATPDELRRIWQSNLSDAREGRIEQMDDTTTLVFGDAGPNATCADVFLFTTDGDAPSLDTIAMVRQAKTTEEAIALAQDMWSRVGGQAILDQKMNKAALAAIDALFEYSDVLRPETSDRSSASVSIEHRHDGYIVRLRIVGASSVQ